MLAPVSHMTSELGIEKRCLACRQFWPADSEFFAPQTNKRSALSPRCRACIAELFWGRGELPAQGAMFNEAALPGRQFRQP